MNTLCRFCQEISIIISKDYCENCQNILDSSNTLEKLFQKYGYHVIKFKNPELKFICSLNKLKLMDSVLL